MNLSHAVLNLPVLPPLLQQRATLEAAKRKLEPAYLECLDDIARRCDIASGDALLDALLDRMNLGNVRCFVVNYYRSRVRK